MEQATPFPRFASPSPSPPLSPSPNPPPGFSSNPSAVSSPLHLGARERKPVHPGDSIFDLGGMESVRLINPVEHSETEARNVAEENTPPLNPILGGSLSSLGSSISSMRSSKPIPGPTENKLFQYGNTQVSVNICVE